MSTPQMNRNNSFQATYQA